MAVQLPDHPVVGVFAMIRMINDGVRDQLSELLPPELTVSQFEMLRLLDAGDGLTPAEIALALHEPKSGVTATLQRLEGSGFVRVEPYPEDGRKKRVWMTPEGLAVYTKAITSIRPQMDKLREAFTLNEFREALPFLKALQTWFVERDWDETSAA